MKVADVAEQLQVSNSIVYALIEAGKLACYRIGIGRGAIRVTKRDLERYLDSTRRPREENEQSKTS